MSAHSAPHHTHSVTHRRFSSVVLLCSARQEPNEIRQFSLPGRQLQQLAVFTVRQLEQHSRFTGENASCWPDASEHPPSYVPQPYPAKRLLGGAICSWSNPQIVEELMFFGDCFKDRMPLGYSGPGWPRPAPRAPIVAERMWAGATATSQDVLERVGCAYWEIPPPPPPSPPPAPGGAFAPMPGS